MIQKEFVALRSPTAQQPFTGPAGREGLTATDPKLGVFAYRAPLWFYILREAELTKKTGELAQDKHGSHHLGPVGGLIVAEVLVGIAHSDHTSYLYQDPNWKPEDERLKSGFDARAKLNTMFDIIQWITDGKMSFKAS